MLNLLKWRRPGRPGSPRVRTAVMGTLGALVLAVAVACSSGSGSDNVLVLASPTPAASPPAAADAPAAPATGGAVENGRPAVTVSGDAPVAPEVIGDVPANSGSPANAVSPSPDEIVAAFETVVARVFNETLPSVVEIDVVTATGGASGSGFVWTDGVHVVTNQHVIDGAQQIEIRFADGRSYSATVTGEDSDADLAVLKMDTNETFRPSVLGDSSQAFPGQVALAIGNPFGEDFTLTQGIVSAVGRSIRSGNQGFTTPDVIQTDAAINPGNSGGPLLTRNGEVIGINTQIRSSSRSNSGVGFAVPINIAKRVVPALISDGKFAYSWLGVSGHDVSRLLADGLDLPEGTRGAYITDVIEGGPALENGISGSTRTIRVDGQPVEVGGDTIVAINGTPIRSMADLISYLTNNTKPGDVIVLDVYQDGGKLVQKTVKLGVRP